MGEPGRHPHRIRVAVAAAAHQVGVDLRDAGVAGLLGQQERHVPLDGLHAGVDVAEGVAPAEVAQRRDQVDPRVGMVDGDRDRERLVVVAGVDDRRPGSCHAGPGHHVLLGQVAADEVHVRAVGQWVLADLVPGTQHHLETPVRGQLGHDPLGATGVVAQQHDVVGEISAITPLRRLPRTDCRAVANWVNSRVSVTMPPTMT